MGYSECPVCGKETYKTVSGEYDIDGLKKLSPDWSWCSSCGFRYVEDCRISEDRAAERYKQRLEREGSTKKKGGRKCHTVSTSDAKYVESCCRRI